MRISEEDLRRRLDSPKNLLRDATAPQAPHLPQAPDVQLHIEHRELPHQGRKVGDKNLPDFLKQIIAESAILGGSAATAASAFEVADATVSRYVNAPTQTPLGRNNRAITSHIRDTALDKLMDSLGIINEETLPKLGARDASQVARNLAGVVEKLTPPEERGISNATLVIYAPQQRDEKQYKIIDV